MKRTIVSLAVLLVFLYSCTTENEVNETLNPESQMVKERYSCYYYTDLTTMGVQLQPEYESKGYVLEKREIPISKTCNVYLPPRYDESKEYPVVYVLHGIQGDENNDWLSGRPSPVAIMDRLINSGEIEPCIAVFPNGRSSSSFTNRSFENQAGFYFFANELAMDLMPFIEEKYSVKAGRDNHALCGLSMGGMQTINVGLCQSLQYFSWFGAFSAAPTSYSAAQVASYLEKQNQQESLPILGFYNLCGTADDIAGASHQQAINGLTGQSEYLNDSNFTEETMPGGHDYRVWQKGLENFLKLCFAGDSKDI